MRSCVVVFFLCLVSAVSSNPLFVSGSKEVFASYPIPKNSELRGVVLLGKESDVIHSREQLQKIEGLVVLDYKLPGNQLTLEKRLFPLGVRKTIDAKALQAIESTIYRYFIENNRPFILLSTPSQRIEDGVVQFCVHESRIDQISIKGNTWSSTERLKKAIYLKEGDSIDQSVLIQNLNFINSNPFRRADVVYSPGRRENTTAIEIVVDERRPIRVYAGTDNTGIKTIQRERVFAGADWGNAFWLGHVFACQYTAAYEVNKFQAITAQYLAPLSWQHILNIYGGYSFVHVALPYPNPTNHGESYQASLRYLIPFTVSGKWRQKAGIGFDVKGLNNTVEFVEMFPIFASLVNITEGVASYEIAWNQSSFDTQAAVQLFISPGELIANETNQNYENLRPGAKNFWVYATGTFKQLYRLPQGCLLSLSFEGQWSSASLLPIEQIGIGGYNTVRGYEERELNMDTGLILNLEVRTSPVAFLARKNVKNKDALQFLGFVDYGWGTDRTPVPGVKKTDYLAGIGPGIRYTLDPYITGRLDWGIKLHHAERFEGGWSMLHFSVTASY